MTMKLGCVCASGLSRWIMTILAALLILCVTVEVTFAAQSTCENTIQCPCGNTARNVTICIETAVADPCKNVSRCKTCKDGLNSCLQCPEGFEGPLCTTEVNLKESREKRQVRYPNNNRRRHWAIRPNNVAPRVGNPIAPSGSCPSIESPKLGSIRCRNTAQERSCIGRCLPGYSFEIYDAEEITLVCRRGGKWEPLSSFPGCVSGGHCDIIVLGGGSFNCTTGMTGTLCDITCSNVKQGRFFCYPGNEWEPPLPSCIRRKVAAEVRQACRCEGGASCDSNGNCVCPAERTGTYCETVRVTCPDPGFIQNGFRMDFNGPQPIARRRYFRGQSVMFDCTEPFTLEGASLLTCTNSGTWSRPLPSCVGPPATEADFSPLYCPDPGKIRFGQVVFYPSIIHRQEMPGEEVFEPDNLPPEYAVGSQLEYTCNAGYELRGRATLTCGPSREWSSEPPVCVRRRMNDCKNPGAFYNGRIQYIPSSNERRPNPPDPNSEVDAEYPPNSRLQYYCNRNYVLQGASTLTCQSSGDWSTRPPICQAAGDIQHCENRGSISNGDIKYNLPGNWRRRNGPRIPPEEMDEFPPGTRLEFRCDNGYMINGAYVMTCESSGHWTAEPPFCDEDCGRPTMQSSLKVINGSLTRPSEWPWMVSISPAENNNTIFCGGAVLNHHTIITAAHCLAQYTSFVLRFGKYHLSVQDDDAEVIVIKTSDRFIHPNYKVVNAVHESDIALLKFRKRIRYSDRIKPICKPTAGSTRRNVKKGRIGHLAAWGVNEDRVQPDQMMHVRLPVVPNEVCEQHYRSLDIDLKMTDNMFCAGYEDARQASCEADSGSPLVFYNNRTRRYTIEGIVSFGMVSQSGACNTASKYTIFTKVYPFLPWIEDNSE